MDRLTEQGHIYRDCEFMEDGMAPYMNRLAAYEDTGLTPEEVIALRDAKDTNVPTTPLALDELRQMEDRGDAVYVCTAGGTPIFRGNRFTAAVLDKTQAFGTLGGWNLQAIYGRGLTLAEGDYGKTWLAYRRKPKEEAL